MSKKTKAHTRYRLKPVGKAKGVIVPGVTTIIGGQLGWNKGALVGWARKQALAGHDPDKIRDEAADSGTCTHHLVECHIKGEEPELGDFTKNQIDKAQTGFLAFLDWEKGNGLEYQAIEMPVVHQEYRYGGTVDMIAWKGDSLWLLDLKTSKNIWPEHRIQVAAYSRAYEHQEMVNLDEHYIVQLNKDDGSFQQHKVSNQQIEDSWEVFLYLRRLYDLQKKF